MKLPNPDRAVGDVAKLREYCLNPRHEDGKHKARVFASALGLHETHAEWLRDRLREAARGDATLVDQISYGSLYVIDFALATAMGEAVVRSGWIVRAAEDFARLTTCYVIKKA